MKPNCAKRVFSGARHDWGGHKCGRDGVVEREGKLWCKQHDPQAVAAKRKIKHTVFEEKKAKERRDYAEASELVKLLGAGSAVWGERAIKLTVNELLNLMPHFKAAFDSLEGG